MTYKQVDLDSSVFSSLYNGRVFHMFLNTLYDVGEVIEVREVVKYTNKVLRTLLVIVTHRILLANDAYNLLIFQEHLSYDARVYLISVKPYHVSD